MELPDPKDKREGRESPTLAQGTKKTEPFIAGFYPQQTDGESLSTPGATTLACTRPWHNHCWLDPPRLRTAREQWMDTHYSQTDIRNPGPEPPPVSQTEPLRLPKPLDAQATMVTGRRSPPTDPPRVQYLLDPVCF